MAEGHEEFSNPNSDSVTVCPFMPLSWLQKAPLDEGGFQVEFFPE